nr:hypothetical protein [Clostridia bacterium]
MSKGSILSIMLIALAVVITFYVLRSVGLYKLAKKQGVENAFLAWIPCVWMFIACKIVGKARIFGTAAEKFAVWACVLFSVAVIIPVVYYGFTIAPYVFRAIQSEDVVMIVSDGTLYVSPELSYSSGLNKFLDIIGVFGNVLRLVEIFITVSVYIALFKKFWPQHYILAAVLSFFGLFGVFAFVIRNNQPVDFNEYIRRRYYNAGFPPYGGYGQGGYNPYNNGGNGYGAPSQGSSEDKEPFGEFSDRPEEPFGEFSSGDKNNNGKNDNDDFFQ